MSLLGRGSLAAAKQTFDLSAPTQLCLFDLQSGLMPDSDFLPHINTLEASSRLEVAYGVS